MSRRAADGVVTSVSAGLLETDLSDANDGRQHGESALTRKGGSLFRLAHRLCRRHHRYPPQREYRREVLGWNLGFAEQGRSTPICFKR